jgi:hypothetical protein
MKVYQFNGLADFVSVFDLANLFNAYPDTKLDDPTQLSYNINRTLMFNNIDKTPLTYFKKYTPKQSDCWTLISYYVYGTTELWWLICKVNGVKDPTIEPFPTYTELKILNKEYVNNILSQIKQG